MPFAPQIALASLSESSTLYWRVALILLIGASLLVRLLWGGGPQSRVFRLRRKGLDRLLAGDPSAAERCYREALNLAPQVSESDRLRLLVCLGDALTDQQRYAEAEQCLEAALQLGDPTGSAQGSMADLLVLEKKNPERAIELADQALQRTSQHPVSRQFGDAWSNVNDELRQAKSWARKAQALAFMDKRTEARQAVDRAMRIVEASKPDLSKAMPAAPLLAGLLFSNRLRNMKSLAIADTNWQIGRALLALHDPAKAAEYLQVVRDADRMGKYRKLAADRLQQLKPPGA